jgi:hypothetical protein
MSTLLSEQGHHTRGRLVIDSCTEYSVLGTSLPYTRRRRYGVVSMYRKPDRATDKSNLVLDAKRERSRGIRTTTYVAVVTQRLLCTVYS